MINPRTAPVSSAADIIEARKMAVAKLTDALTVLVAACNDSFAPVNIRQIIEVAEIRLTALKELY